MRLLRYIFVILLFSGCGGRTTIGDDELALIFRDAFLSNAYVTTQSIRLDSLRLYEPIFNSYGYTTEDVQYTLGNFAMRKSARLGDVVEEAISMLEDEGVKLDREVDILNTLDDLIKRDADKMILSDTLIKVAKLEDTTKLHLTLNNPRRGLYRMKMVYNIADDPSSIFRTEWRSESIFYGAAADSTDSIAVRSTRVAQMRKSNGQRLESTLSVGDSVDRIVIELAKAKKFLVDSIPNIEITDFELWREPSEADARIEVFNSIVDIDIFGDELLFAKDSL